MPPHEQQPKFFLDRSLGRIAVPARLRAADWDLVTLAEQRIRYRRAEIDAVAQHEAQCFVITRGDLTSAMMADRFQASKRAIYEAVNESGPFIYAVHSDRLELLYPRDVRL